LPAGVSGAYCLFANLMAKEDDKISGVEENKE